MEITGRLRALGQVSLLVVGIFVGQMILYGPSLLGRKVLLPLDILALPQVYIPQTPGAQETRLHNFILSDLVYTGEPARMFQNKELRLGRWPSWNPYQFAGVPLLASQFSPFSLLLTGFTSPVIIAWVQVIIAEVAAIGFYWFCRRVLRTSFWPAVVTAWCYPITGFFIFWQGYGSPMTVCWLPWLLTVVDAVIRGGTRWAWLSMAVLTGLVIVSGQTDVAGQVLLTSGLFACCRLIENYRQEFYCTQGRYRCLRTVLLLVGGWTVGFLLAAPHLLPLLEHSRTGIRMELRNKGVEERPPIGLAALPQVLVPHFWGSTEAGFFPVFPKEQGNLLESSSTGYAGLLTALLLAPLAFCSRRHRFLNIFWVLLAFVALSWQLNIPVMVQLLRLPPLNMLSYNRFTFAAAFSILAMSATGLDVIVRNQWDRRWWFGVPMILLTILFSFTAYQVAMPPEPLRSQLEAVIGQGQRIGQITSIEAVREIQGNFSKTYLITIILCWAGLGGWFYLCTQEKLRVPTWFIVGISTLMIAELLWYGYGRSTQCDWSLYYPEIPVLKQVAQEVQSNQGRVIGVSCLPAILAQTQGLSDVRGYDAIDPARYVHLLLKASDPHSPVMPYAMTQMMVPAIFSPPSKILRLHPILDMLGVRYLIFRGSPVKGIPSYLIGDDYWVMENSFALPRVFIPQRVEAVADENICLERVADRSFDPQKVAYVESELKTVLPEECRGKAEIIRETPTEIIISATMETAGMLVLADRWDQGWNAYVIQEIQDIRLGNEPSNISRAEYKQVPIRQVNYAVRGVELRAGESTIVFSYEPASMTWGLILGGSALVIILVSVFQTWWNRNE